MYTVGQEELDAIAEIISQGTLFRCGIGGECDRTARIGDWVRERGLEIIGLRAIRDDLRTEG